METLHRRRTHTRSQVHTTSRRRLATGRNSRLLQEFIWPCSLSIVQSPGEPPPRTVPTPRTAPNRKASMAVPTHPCSSHAPTATFFLAPGPAFALAHMGRGVRVPWYPAGTSGNQPSAKPTQGRPGSLGAPGGGTLGALARPYLTPSSQERERERGSHPRTVAPAPQKPSFPGQALAVISTRMLPLSLHPRRSPPV